VLKVDLFSYDSGKTPNVNHRHRPIKNNKTADIKVKKLKSIQRHVRSLGRLYIINITQLQLQKNNKEYDITLHYIDIMAM